MIGPLSKLLDAHRMALGNPIAGPIFPGPRGNPMDLNNLSRDVIRPTLEAAGLQWHGWHAFRRGLATNLHDLGTDDKTIQLILRDSDVAVTAQLHQRSAFSGCRCDA